MVKKQKEPLGSTKLLGTSIPNTWIIIIVVILAISGGLGAGIKMKSQRMARDVAEGIGDVLGDEGAAPDTRGNYVGGVAFAIDETDWLAHIAAAPTGPSYNLFYELPTAKTAVGKSVSTSGSTISVDGSGFVWIDLYGGSDFYLVESALRAGNPAKVQSVVYNDWDQDGSLDMLVKFDVANIGVTGQGIAPTYDINLPLLDTDVTGLTSDSPADQTGLGEVEVVVQVEHKLSLCNAADGFVISEIKYVTNSTNEGDQITFEELDVSGQWTLTGPNYFRAPIKTENGDYQVWYILADDRQDPLDPGAAMVYRETNRGDSLTLSANCRLTLATNNMIEVTLTVTITDPAGVKSTITDLVLLDEAA